MRTRRAVITLAIGSAFEEMGRYTHPLMRKYAERCGASFIVLNGRRLEGKLGRITYEKFQLHEHLRGTFEHVLFLDTDIVVCPNAPNVFEGNSPDVFCAANEEAYSKASMHKDRTCEILGNVKWTAPYFNSGVMLIGPSHAPLFDPSNPILQQWAKHKDNEDHIMSDQPILNYLVNRYQIPFKDLGHKFNHTRVIRDTASRFRSYFIHYAGPSGHRYGSRICQIKADCRIASNPFSFEISRRLPQYRWVADRLNADFISYLLKR